MRIKLVLAIAAAVCFAVVSFGCGGGATNSTSNTAAKPANTTTTTSSTTATETTSTTASDLTSTGVAECDEYIKKYEACLTEISKKAPQSEATIKSSFETARNTIKSAASTPQGKATLPATCKQMTDAAKASTSQWCTW